MTIKSGFIKGLFEQKQKKANEELNTTVELPEVEAEEETINEEIEVDIITDKTPLQVLYTDWRLRSGKDFLSERASSVMIEEIVKKEEFEKYKLHSYVDLFIVQIRDECEVRLKNKEDFELKNKSNEEEAKEIYSSDAKPLIYFTPENMIALVCVLPPEGNGKDIDLKSFLELIQTSGIKNGMQKDTMHEILSEKKYFTISIIAIGTEVVNGNDGKVIEHMPRNIEATYEENEKGDVDFKKLHMLKEVKKGDVICDIEYPTDGKDGMDIKGNPIKAKRGQAAIIPKGLNTEVVEDKLVASEEGYVTYKDGVFKVAHILEIDGNVDLSVGSLDYCGDIVIKGDVLGGFEIKADGDITIMGMVEDAYIKAGGDVTICNGMNGNAKGEIRANGVVKCSFLENVNVYSGGDIHAKSIVCSKIFCDRTVYANEGMGVIIGGSITAMQSIKARIIGSKANRRTEIILGTLPNVVSQGKETEKKLEEIENNITLLEKSIRYLKGLKEISEKKEKLLSQCESQLKKCFNERDEIKQRFDDIKKLVDITEKANITCDILYPPVVLDIKGVKRNIESSMRDTKIFLSEESEIIIDSM